MSKESSKFDVDDLFDEIGSFGLFQINNNILIYIAIVLSAPFTMSFVFTAADLNYRCKVDQCDMSGAYHTEWFNHSTTYDAKGDLVKCEMYKFVGNITSGNYTCSTDNFDKTVKVSCNEFIYETNEVTIVRERWNLNCSENKWKLTLLGTINSVGQCIALALVGLISDKFGRKFALIFGFMASGILGLIRSFANSYMFFFIFELLDPAIGSGIFSACYILAMELIGVKYRALTSVMTFTAYAVGEILLGSLAMITLDWRLLIRTLYAPAFLFLSYHWLLPESVRWLHSSHQYDKIELIIKGAARMNKKKLTNATLEKIENWKTAETDKENEAIFIQNQVVQKLDIKQLLNYPTILLRVMSISFVWITHTLVYYGLSLNSIALGGNKFTNFIAVCAIELPAYAISYIMANKLGRKKSLAGALFLSGFASICNGILETNETWTLILFLVGKFAITISFQVMYLIAAELFPTPLRHTLLGWCSTFGRFGAMLAPQTPLLESISKSLPSLIFGATAIISGALALQYPETLNRKLPDTLEEAVNIGKKSKLRLKPESFIEEFLQKNIHLHGKFNFYKRVGKQQHHISRNIISFIFWNFLFSKM